MAGYFFFNRIEKLENEAEKKEYAISYLLKTLKIYFVWSVVLLPSRLILSKSSMLGVLLKWFRTVFFIGDAQLWYLNALLIGLILILILKKSKINDTWIMLIGVVFFIAGIFVQKQLDVASVNGYAGFWKLYYMIWGKTIKNGVFMGMFYCMLGTLIQKIPQTKTVFICTISAFILYVVGVYFQYEWRKLLLPVVSVLVVESVIMLPLTPDFLAVLEEGFKEFFEKEVPGNPLKAEYLIPIFIGQLLEQGKMFVKVLKTNDTWYGMTYHEDVAAVKDSFKKMLENGVYKADLFSNL